MNQYLKIIFIQFRVQMEQDLIVFEVQTEEGKRSVKFEKKLLQFNIGILNNNHNEPYSIPKTIVSTIQPLQAMKEFLQVHNYQPNSIRVNKPIKSANFQEQVDDATFLSLEKYSKEANFQAAEKLIILAKFLDFNQLYDAARAAVAVNFYIGLDQNSFNSFVKANGLENITTQEIHEIIKQNEQIFTMIELKAKQELFSEQPKI